MQGARILLTDINLQLNYLLAGDQRFGSSQKYGVRVPEKSSLVLSHSSASACAFHAWFLCSVTVNIGCLFSVPGPLPALSDVVQFHEIHRWSLHGFHLCACGNMSFWVGFCFYFLFCLFQGDSAGCVCSRLTPGGAWG